MLDKFYLEDGQRLSLRYTIARELVSNILMHREYHPDPNDPDAKEELDEQFPDGMFRFEKRMN